MFNVRFSVFSFNGSVGWEGSSKRDKIKTARWNIQCTRGQLVRKAQNVAGKFAHKRAHSRVFGVQSLQIHQIGVLSREQSVQRASKSRYNSGRVARQRGQNNQTSVINFFYNYYTTIITQLPSIFVSLDHWSTLYCGIFSIMKKQTNMRIKRCFTIIELTTPAASSRELTVRPIKAPKIRAKFTSTNTTIN